MPRRRSRLRAEGEKPAGAITKRRTTCRARVNEVRSAVHCAMRAASTSRSRVAWCPGPGTGPAGPALARRSTGPGQASRTAPDPGLETAADHPAQHHQDVPEDPGNNHHQTVPEASAEHLQDHGHTPLVSPSQPHSRHAHQGKHPMSHTASQG